MGKEFPGIFGLQLVTAAYNFGIGFALRADCDETVWNLADKKTAQGFGCIETRRGPNFNYAIDIQWSGWAKSNSHKAESNSNSQSWSAGINFNLERDALRA
jgi:hypothetical protein